MAWRRLIARLLVVGLWLAMGLVLVGVVLMLATGTDPLATAPSRPSTSRRSRPRCSPCSPPASCGSGSSWSSRCPSAGSWSRASGFLAVARPSDGADLAARAPGRACLDRGRHRHWELTMDILVLAIAFVVILLGRRAVHQRHRVVRAQARPGRGRRRVGPGGRRDRPARDDDPDHRHRVRRGRRGHRRGRASARSWARRSCSRRWRCSSPASPSSTGEGAARPGRACSWTRAVLGHDMRYFVIAYALAIGAAFLPPELVGSGSSWPSC